MKKTISIIAAIVIFGSVSLAHAQSIDTTGMTDSQLLTLLVSLYEQLVTLENQVLAQTTVIQTQTTPATTTPALPPDLGSTPNTTSTPTMPTIQKTITLSQEGQRIFAVYAEDGTPVANVPLTLTADDNGLISHSSVADKWATANNVELTHDVSVFNVPGFSIGAVFEYQPEATGTRTLTVEGNGVSQTLTIQN